MPPEQPKTYQKGPDVMSKSAQTQRRYVRAFRGQGKLTGFGFKAPAHPTRVLGPKAKGKAKSPISIEDSDSEPITQPRAQHPLDIGLSRARSASVLSDPSTDGEGAPSGLADVEEMDAGESACEIESPDNMDHDELEDWEVELEESIQGPTTHIRDWSDLRKQIKDHLKKNSKALPLSQVNQLLIISNFATLRIKGVSRTQASLEIARQWHEGQGNWFSRRVQALARHYQIFEALPIERHGGARQSRSWLYDEQVKTRTRDWLTSQKTGDVTPRRLQYALNQTIFPELNITLTKGISERTARCWLIRLGWRQTVVRKGVYMDGHEHADVVEYQNNVFLLAIAQFEALVAKHEGPELKKIMPEIQEGQRRIIIQYHDECCFHSCK